MPRALAGRYHLVRPLARGGMAEVWEGRDEVLSRSVAVKVLLPHLTADPALRERFRREAVTAARLVHPGIVAVFDAGVEPEPQYLGDDGQTDLAPLRLGQGRDPTMEREWRYGRGTAFIVMELVPGQTLRELLRRRGPLPPRLAVAIAAQVTDALVYAHSLGLVHRDIKPANVLLRDEGPGLAQVKVADFGIAKAAAVTSDLTAQGALLGTPKYVSPEQVRGEEPDARADLYSLGVVMFEMLAGEPPFYAGADMATALAHVQQPAPRLADVRPGLPKGLSELVAALLEKQRDKRVPSALALAERLGEIALELGLPAAGPGTSLELETAPAVDGVRSRGAKSSEGTWSAALRSPTVTETAAGAGGAAAVAESPDEPARDWRLARAKRSSRAPSLVVAALVAGGAAVAAALVYQNGPTGAHGGPSGGSGPSGASSGHSLRVVAVREVAVNGNSPDDNLNELPNVISNNPATYWKSLQYLGPRFGNYGGLGLALQLARTHLVHELVVTTPMRDWSAEVFVASRFSSSLAGWGKPLSPRYGLNGDHTFSFPARRGDWVLFWMLNPGPTYQATVDKLSVR